MGLSSSSLLEEGISFWTIVLADGLVGLHLAVGGGEERGHGGGEAFLGASSSLEQCGRRSGVRPAAPEPVPGPGEGPASHERLRGRACLEEPLAGREPRTRHSHRGCGHRTGDLGPPLPARLLLTRPCVFPGQSVVTGVHSPRGPTPRREGPFPALQGSSSGTCQPDD